MEVNSRSARHRGEEGEQSVKANLGRACKEGVEPMRWRRSLGGGGGAFEKEEEPVRGGGGGRGACEQLHFVVATVLRFVLNVFARSIELKRRNKS